jgi:putative ABC transport system substrate-binding protein
MPLTVSHELGILNLSSAGEDRAPWRNEDDGSSTRTAMHWEELDRRNVCKLLSGVVAGWPLPATGQQTVPVVGFLHQGSREPSSNMNAFRNGLSELGFIEGQSVTIEDRAADGHYDRLPALAAELVVRQVSVIAANFLPAALAAKGATQTIPIVFLSGSDPIRAGLVSSINRPTGNVTGIAPMFTLLGTKNLELLHELVPKVTVIGGLANLTNPNAEHQLKDVKAAALALGKELVVLDGSNEQKIDASFATIAQRRIGALVVTADGFLISRQDQIIALASRYAVPTMYPLSQYVVAGGLMSYGANLRDAFRQTGIYVGRILKGTKPTDLPVLQPIKVEFVINLKTARALGVNVPPQLLALADETVE